MSVMKNSEGPENHCEKAVEVCKMTREMILINAQHMDGLRTECSPTAALTQQEIRALEKKLIIQFSRQLVAKARVPEELRTRELQAYPDCKSWLHVVGLQKQTIKELMADDLTVEVLLDMSNDELRQLLQKHGIIETEEERRLLTACSRLRQCTAVQLLGEKAMPDMELHWDSWDMTQSTSMPSPIHMGGSPRTRRTDRAARASVASEEVLASPISPTPSISSTPSSPAHYYGQDRRCTPPQTPSLMAKSRGKFPTTPPPKKKMATWLQPGEGFPLIKSKSHESQLANRVDLGPPVNTGSLPKTKKKPEELWLGRSLEALSQHTIDGSTGSRGQSGHSSPSVSSPARSPPGGSESGDSVVVPKSPRTPTCPVIGSMGHSIQHRFVNAIEMPPCPCDHCGKPVMFRGKRCKECKRKFHKQCALRATPSCGLPDGLVNHFKQVQFSFSGGEENPSPVAAACSLAVLPPVAGHVRQGRHQGHRPTVSVSVSAFQGPDSSSNTSSCNSSTPSSPALLVAPPQAEQVAEQMQRHRIQVSPSASPRRLSPHVLPDAFDFPEAVSDSLDSGIALSFVKNGNVSETLASQKSSDSDKSTVTGGDFEKTSPMRIDSLESQQSDHEPGDLGERRSVHRESSLSNALREWDIPYEELVIAERIGTGWFGTVCRGQWHGDVAVKLLNIDHADESDYELQLEAFKAEVATFRKTRHENVVLFMGVCMQPPETLAIVTSLLKGNTLYTHLYVKNTKFTMNKAVLIATQVAQGMGYLHARGIVHKDLKTKNIFLENGKVVITDFGLFNVAKLCRQNKDNWLSIPPGWLCYLSPEIIKSLEARWRHDHDLPFKATSDVFAFGTMLYELLCGEQPFKQQPPEAIIWQVGKGIKQPFGHIQASRELKELLMLCWSYKEEERPDFTWLQKHLEKLPKKRLARSPSHPVKLSRSAESVF